MLYSGITGSEDFPTTFGAFDTSFNGGYYDVFVTKIAFISIDIKANGSDGPIKISRPDDLVIDVALDANGITIDADWWLIAKTPMGFYHYDKVMLSWEPGIEVTHQGRLRNINPRNVLNMSGLPIGTYNFFLGVDTVMDGVVTDVSHIYDRVQVKIIP